MEHSPFHLWDPRQLTEPKVAPTSRDDLTVQLTLWRHCEAAFVNLPDAQDSFYVQKKKH